jgi:hypothetical protein
MYADSPGFVAEWEVFSPDIKAESLLDNVWLECIPNGVIPLTLADRKTALMQLFTEMDHFIRGFEVEKEDD